MTERLTAAVVDAFTSAPYAGNPAAVVLLPGESPAAGGAAAAVSGVDEAWMRRVAAEFNLSETAFVRRRDDGSYDLRWFTPTVEVNLCGHATLASAHVLWERGLVPEPATGAARLTFHTLSGELGASRDGEGRVVVDLPGAPIVDKDPMDGIADVLGVDHTWIGATAGATPGSRNGLAVLAPGDLLALKPDLRRLLEVELGGLIVSARPDPADAAFNGVDVISRYFAPAAGIDEDPVTGSAHCTIADHWATALGREILRCRQMSRRTGDLLVTRAGARVSVAGHAVTVMDVTLR